MHFEQDLSDHGARHGLSAVLPAPQDLWLVFGDVSQPLTPTVRHLLARVLCLILLPAMLYLLSYGVHFGVLYCI